MLMTYLLLFIYSIYFLSVFSFDLFELSSPLYELSSPYMHSRLVCILASTTLASMCIHSTRVLARS